MVNEDTSTTGLLLIMKKKQSEANKACTLLYIRFMIILCQRGKSLKLPLADAEDIAQDTLLQVIKSISSFDERCGDGNAWIYMIHRNKVINWLKRKRLIQFEPLIEAYSCSEQDSPEQWIENDHLRQAMDRAWECLPEWARQELLSRSGPGRKSKKWHQARILFGDSLAEERKND